MKVRIEIEFSDKNEHLFRRNARLRTTKIAVLNRIIAKASRPLPNNKIDLFKENEWVFQVNPKNETPESKPKAYVKRAYVKRASKQPEPAEMPVVKQPEPVVEKQPEPAEMPVENQAEPVAVETTVSKWKKFVSPKAVLNRNENNKRDN